jgi:hypothetical protein
MRAKVESALMRFGLDGPSRAFVVKALDPVGPERSPGIPDQMASHVLRPEYRVTSTVQGPPGASQWDLFVWTPPGDHTALVWAAAPSPADFTSQVAPAGSTFGMIPLQPVTSSGIIGQYVDVLGGSVVLGPQFTTQFVTAKPYTFRHTCKSVTAELVAAAVNDQGDVYAAQYSPQYVGRSGCAALGPSTIPGTNYMGVLETVRIPFTEGDLTLASPGRYQGRAKDGVYMVHSLSGPSQPFANVAVPAIFGSTSPFAGPPPGFSVPCFNTGGSTSAIQYSHVMGVTNNDSGDPSTLGSIPWVNYGTGFSGQSAPLSSADTGFDNTNIGVMIFRGLAGPGSGGGSFGASVMFKVVVGLEIISRPTGVDRIFAEAPMPYHPRALEAYYGIDSELEDAYPASFNFLGGILGTIGSVASKLWPVVKQLAPVVSGVIDKFAGTEEPAQAPQPVRQARLIEAPRSTSRAPSIRRSSSVLKTMKLKSSSRKKKR